MYKKILNIYIYIYIYMCVCVCVCVLPKTLNPKHPSKKKKNIYIYILKKNRIYDSFFDFTIYDFVSSS